MPSPLDSSFSRKLLKWYDKSCRDLPWRETDDPYKIWISEVMLQQTTVKSVIERYKTWIVEFPTIFDVSNANYERILKAWQGLGYYNRARNLHKAAKIIVKEYDGRIPDDPGRLKLIPGFGPYTIGAVLSIAYQKSVPLIDANVRRVFMRLLKYEGLASSKIDYKILPTLCQILPRQRPGDFNQALMELGALICRSKEPTCNLCPLRSFCAAYEQDVQEIIPAPLKLEKREIEAVVAIIFDKNGRVFIQQRPSKGLLADLWEFPGGKIEPGEAPAGALKRELLEELGVFSSPGDVLGRVTHYYTQFKVNLVAMSCKVTGQIKMNRQRRWVKLTDLERFAMPSGSAKIVEILKSNC